MIKFLKSERKYLKLIYDKYSFGYVKEVLARKNATDKSTKI